MELALQQLETMGWISTAMLVTALIALVLVAGTGEK